MNVLLISLALAYLVFAFTKTNFIVEYASLFGLGWLFKAKEYEEWKDKNEMDHGYHMFIRETYSGFIPRMLGCPYCLIGFTSIWGALLISVGLSLAFWSPLLLKFVLYSPAIAGLSSLLFTLQELLYKLAFEK